MAWLRRLRHHTATALVVSLVGASARAPSISATQAPASASAITFARQAPDSLRERLRRHLAQSTGVASDAEQRRHLKAARDLAGLYAVAWHDSVLLRQVDRFE